MYLLLLYQIRDIDSKSREMPWPQTGATQIGLPDKVRAIKVLVVCYDCPINFKLGMMILNTVRYNVEAEATR